MAETTPFTIGTKASCSDGECGELTRVVLDPVAKKVTHLVIQPTHGESPARLVPLSLVDATADEITMHCTVAEFEQLDAAEETRFLPGLDELYAQGQVLSWPYYSLGAPGMPAFADPGLEEPVTYDRVPVGEVAVRRGDHVHATDGRIGLVQGLVIDPADHHVTHVLLQEGHLWGRKEVAIPISAVTRVDDGIRLNISKKDVQDLPPVAIDQLQA
jgi:sporulation protein YlmC with PRC-barrel domain